MTTTLLASSMHSTALTPLGFLLLKVLLFFGSLFFLRTRKASPSSAAKPEGVPASGNWAVHLKRSVPSEGKRAIAPRGPA